MPAMCLPRLWRFACAGAESLYILAHEPLAHTVAAMMRFTPLVSMRPQSDSPQCLPPSASWRVASPDGHAHVQEFDAAKELLLQTVLQYSTARTRRVSAAAAALESLAVLFIAQGDAASASNCLDQSLAVSSILEQDRSMRQLNSVEVAKVYFLKSLLCKRLGEAETVRWACSIRSSVLCAVVLCSVSLCSAASSAAS